MNKGKTSISETEKFHIVEKKSKNWFFDMINKINKTTSTLIKENWEQNIYD